MKLLISVGIIIGIVLSVFVFIFMLTFFDENHGAVSTGFFLVLKDILGPVAAGFGGAISAAVVAFYMADQAERKREDRVIIQGYHTALKIITSKLNELVSIKAGIVTPVCDDPFRFIMIPVFPPAAPMSESADRLVAELFLALGKADLLNELSVAESRYRSCFINFESRALSMNKYYAKRELHPRGNESEIELSDIVEIIGTAELLNLYSFTEDLLRLMQKAIDDFEAVVPRINEEVGSTLRKRGLKVAPIELVDEALPAIPPPRITDREHLIHVIAEIKAAANK